MIDSPRNQEHPSFIGQLDYEVTRVVVDTGDDTHPDYVLIAVRHRESRVNRKFRFEGIVLRSIGAIAEIGGYLPVYVATVDGRGWERDVTVEVGDTDPGGVWFWARNIVELPTESTGGAFEGR